MSSSFNAHVFNRASHFGTDSPVFSGLTRITFSSSASQILLKVPEEVTATRRPVPCRTPPSECGQTSFHPQPKLRWPIKAFAEHRLQPVAPLPMAVAHAPDEPLQ